MTLKRTVLISLCLMVIPVSGIPAAELALIPAPKEAVQKSGFVEIANDWNIITRSKGEIFILAEYLRDQLQDRFDISLGIKQGTPSTPKFIELGLSGEGMEGKGGEAYTLEVFENSILINGNKPAGVFYGIQSLLQLAGKGKGGILVNAVKITDYPGLKYRGVHICSADPEHLKEQLEIMAGLKLNFAIIDNWGYYDLDKPEVRQVFEDIFDYARRLYIEPVPEIANFGPGGPILIRKPYAAEGIYEKEEHYRFVDGEARPVKPSKHSLVNVIRSEGSDFAVESLDGSKTYKEGSDYKFVGSEIIYPYSLNTRPSKIIRLPYGRIKDGEEVLVSYDYVECKSASWAPWSIPYCPSSEETYKVIFHSIDNVISILSPHYINIGHDEIRGINRDSRCINRHVTSAELLADDINKIYDYVKSVDPGVKLLMWDDMINPWHNGSNSGYQVEFGGPPGSTQAAVDLIPKDIILMIWWYDAEDWLSKMKNSPSYFESKGFAYLAAAYKDKKNIKDWEKIAKGRPKCAGLITTTWDGWDNNLDGIKYAAEEAW